MTEQQEHLQSALQQRESLVKEIQNLNTEIAEKREMVFKLQGIVEYLQQIGVSLPETEESVEEEQTENE
jgi:hypothetical protein